MKLTTTSLLLRSNGSRFFTRKRAAAAAENPEPTSPQVSCIGQVRLQKAKQCRRRIGEVSFRSTEQPPPTRWLHLPNISVVLQELCCLFRCRCCCFGRREKKINVCGINDTLVGRRGNSRRHVFDDIEVKGRSGEGDSDSICTPPKNALLLMRCRSDPLKMVATANRISSDAATYAHGDNILEEENGDQTTSSDEIVEEMRLDDHREKLVISGEEKVQQEQENTEHDRDVEAKSDDENESDKVEAQLPECLLLMMREPKLSMEVSKETWVCATDFIRLLPERPRVPDAKPADGRGDHEPVIKRRDTVKKPRPRVPAQCGRRNDVELARSSSSLLAVSTAAVVERKLVNGGACEPLALTRCKSEPLCTAAAKLMPESSCWKDNLEPHRQAFGAAGVGC